MRKLLGYFIKKIYFYLYSKDARVESIALFVLQRQFRLKRVLRKLGRQFFPSLIQEKVYGDTLCALPWMHYFINEKGHHFPCCISTESAVNATLDGYGRPYKAHTAEGFKQAWNSDSMKEIRMDMLAGRRPKACERCYKFEDLGIRSNRQHANNRWERVADPLIRDTSQDGTAPLQIYSADIRVGNLCNLKCRMCSPVSSKGLATEWKQLRMMNEHEAQKLLDMKWFEEPEFWDMFLHHSDDLQALHFAGGEPFIIKKHFAFLKSLVERKISNRLSLTYNTNLTMLPPELLELWKNFKQIDLMISLDGTEDVNHYIRFPSNWMQIQKNLREVHDHMDEYRIRSLCINVTVQVYNIFNLPKLLDFLFSEYPKASFPTLSLLFAPEELSIQILPKDVKEKLTALWTSYLNERRELWVHRSKWEVDGDEFIRNVEGIIQFLNQGDASHLLSQFRKRTEAFDRSRKQSFADVVPELAPLM